MWDAVVISGDVRGVRSGVAVTDLSRRRHRILAAVMVFIGMWLMKGLLFH